MRLIQGTFNTVWVWYSRNVRCRVLSGAVPGRPNSEPSAAFLQVRWCTRAGNMSRRRRRRRSTIWQKLLVKRVWNAASCSLMVSANVERRSRGGIKTCCCWRAPSCDLKDVELPSGLCCSTVLWDNFGLECFVSVLSSHSCLPLLIVLVWPVAWRGHDSNNFLGRGKQPCTA